MDDISTGLECRGVGLNYGTPQVDQQVILREVYASFHPGRIALISGSIGAGKSSLLHILAGLIRPTCGTVYADGQPISRWISSHRDVWRRKIGILFQNPYFFNELSVLENLMLPMVPRGFNTRELMKKALSTLDQLEISHLAQKNLATLSGGQKQRLSMARALIGEPQFLIVDEPTAHQDDHGFDVMLAQLRAAGSRKATVVVAAHDVRIIQAVIAEDLWLLAEGQLKRLA